MPKYNDNIDDEEMAPEEESFPPEEESAQNRGNSSLGAKNPAQVNANHKSGEAIQNKVAEGKAKQLQSNAQAARENSKKKNEEGEDGEQDPKKAAEQQAGTDAAKLALKKVAQAYAPEIPEPIIDKLVDKVVDSDLGQEAIKKLIDEYKKKKKQMILQMIPPLFQVFMGVIVVIFVMALLVGSFSFVLEKIDSGLVYLENFSEKMSNLFEGDGWNTEEEVFFKSLQKAVEETDEYGDKIDPALIVSTIQYNHVFDIDTYAEEDIGETDTSVNTESTDTETAFPAYLAATELKTFYYVSNDKLGGIHEIGIGKKRLIGHMYDVDFSLQFMNLSSSLENWGRFLKYFGKEGISVGKEIFELLTFGDIRNFVESELEYAKYKDMLKVDQDTYTEYYWRNIKYEAKEMIDAIDELFSGSSTTSASKDESGFFITPVIKMTVDEEKYYNYLIEVYIPGTFFSSADPDDPTIQTKIKYIADDIFSQRDSYIDVMMNGSGDASVSTGRYVYSSAYDFTATLNDIPLTSNVINNLNVEIYPGTCGNTITDCNGTSLEATVSFKDYVLGIGYSELGIVSTDPAEVTKASYVAIQSYALNSFGGTLREESGKYYIQAINGNNYQEYCSIYSGCIYKPAQDTATISTLESIYAGVKYEFVFDKNKGTFAGSYSESQSNCISSGMTGACLGISSANADAAEHYNYKNILGKYYNDGIDLINVSTQKAYSPVKEYYSAGLVAGNHGNIMIRTTAPISSDKYYNPPYVSNSNIGQCVWYVKGRAQEIVGTSVTDIELREKLIDVLMHSSGNGNQWYNDNLKKVFGSSTDYTKPKPGSIGVYDWVKPDSQGNNYGHSVIIEDVDGDTVYVSQGSNGCGGAYGAAAWSCVHVTYKAYTISQMQNLNIPGYFKFIGYIYLLD